MLSNGDVEEKGPADLKGSAVGETTQKTAALIANCSGKVSWRAVYNLLAYADIAENPRTPTQVLLIDEAYLLDDDAYGKEALNTLVSKVCLDQFIPPNDVP